MRKMAVFTLFFALVLVASVGTANAMISGQLKNLKVVEVRYSTNVIGTENQKDLAARGTNDPSKMRVMIVTVAAEAPPSPTAIFANEFILKYDLGNSETRAHCMGIASMNPDSLPTTLFLTGLFNEPAIRVSGQSKFVLLFLIEQEPTAFMLLQTGTEREVSFNSYSRKMSVLLATNTLNSASMERLKESLESGGCDVTTIYSLTQDIKGATIYYMPKAENTARELSQRLINRLNMEPTVAENSLVTSYDIVVWVGKGCQLKKISL